MKLIELADKLKECDFADKDSLDKEVAAMIIILDDDYGYKRGYQLEGDSIYPI